MSLAALGASARCCASARILHPSSTTTLLSVARRGMAAASEDSPYSAAPGGALLAPARRSRNARGGRRMCRDAFPGSVRSGVSAASVGRPSAPEREHGAEPLASDAGSLPCTSRKKRVALWLGYVGTSFRGLQIQPEDYERHTAPSRGGEGELGSTIERDSANGPLGVKNKGAKEGAVGTSDTPSCSVEAVVEEAILRAGLMLPSNFGDLRKLGWSRSSRTDKGVHSVATVLSLKMEVPAGALDPDTDADGDSLASQINEHLPDTVRVFGVLPVSKGFCARSACVSRVYHYLVPLRALLPSEGSPRHQDGGHMAPWGEDASGSKSAWQHYQCSVEEWNAVLEFDRVLRTFEGRHAFHNYTVRRIYRPEEGRSRSTQRQKGQYASAKPSAGSDMQVADEERAGEGGPVREEQSDGEERDRRSCVPAQVCNARAAAALSRAHFPGLLTHAGEGLEEGRAAPPSAATECKEPLAVLAHASAASVEGRPLCDGGENDALVGHQTEGAAHGARGEVEVGGRSDGAGGAVGIEGGDLQRKPGELQSEKADAEVKPSAGGVQSRYGRKAWWVHASPRDAPTSVGKGDRIGAAHFRRVQSCRVHVPALGGGARGGGEEGRVIDVWCGAPCVRIVIQGESFMLHQIRKMVGTAIGVVRGKVPESLLLPSLARHCRMVLPLAPPHGLILASAIFSPPRGPGPRVKAPPAEEADLQGVTFASQRTAAQTGDAKLEAGGDLLPLPVSGPESQAPRLSTAVKARMAQFYSTRLLPAVAPSLLQPSSLAGESVQSVEPWTDWVENLDFHSWVTEEEVNEITSAMRAWAAHLEAIKSTDPM